MATGMTPAQFVAAFTKWHVDLHLFPGYQTRGNGPISNATAVMWHHTGSDAGQSDDYLDFLFNRGSSVPPPLCNFATDMDGDFWLGACEQANHSGSGSTAVRDKVASGNYDWRNTTLQPGPDNFTGNDWYYGNEFRFDGGQPMTQAMYVSGILSTAAICDFHGWGAWHVLGHKEHTSRKIDPGNTSMPQVRRDVAAALAAGPGNWPTLTEVDMLTDAQAAQLAKAGWLADQFGQGAQFEEQLDLIQSNGEMILDNLAELRGMADGIRIIANSIKTKMDSDAALAAARWTQGTNEGRQQETRLQMKLDAAIVKLDQLIAAHEPPPGA